MWEFFIIIVRICRFWFWFLYRIFNLGCGIFGSGLRDCFFTLALRIAFGIRSVGWFIGILLLPLGIGRPQWPCFSSGWRFFFIAFFLFLLLTLHILLLHFLHFGVLHGLFDCRLTRVAGSNHFLFSLPFLLAALFIVVTGTAVAIDVNFSLACERIPLLGDVRSCVRLSVVAVVAASLALKPPRPIGGTKVACCDTGAKGFLRTSQRY
mmetsp:Transcript_39722/g.81086  ORF Transcript_39722/g.81086 Transcript_39722/m.81086 type:complete len:208 (+) Transcript_39722:213-836(+)